jgi:hypothetical protein
MSKGRFLSIYPQCGLCWAKREHGADPHRVRPDDQRPAALAEKRGYLNIAALIKHYAAVLQPQTSSH